MVVLPDRGELKILHDFPVELKDGETYKNAKKYAAEDFSKLVSLVRTTLEKAIHQEQILCGKEC